MSSAQSILLGAGSCLAILVGFLAAPASFIEIATLMATGAILIWFATVDPEHLVNADRRPQGRLFFLAGTALALLISAMVRFASGTMLLTMGLGVGAITVGLVRAVRFRPGSTR